MESRLPADLNIVRGEAPGQRRRTFFESSIAAQTIFDNTLKVRRILESLGDTNQANTPSEKDEAAPSEKDETAASEKDDADEDDEEAELMRILHLAEEDEDMELVDEDDESIHGLDRVYSNMSGVGHDESNSNIQDVDAPPVTVYCDVCDRPQLLPVAVEAYTCQTCSHPELYRSKPLSRTVSSLDDVVTLLRTACNVAVVAGAGMSVSTGVPDFRSENGLYAIMKGMRVGATGRPLTGSVRISLL
jgi:hypothetical protein